MDLDFSKKLCESTLGEFIAAERTVGIMTGWMVAILTASAMLLVRWGYKKWKGWKENKRLAATASIAWYATYKDNETRCLFCRAHVPNAGQLSQCPYCGWNGATKGQMGIILQNK